jgi:hypothetical protein
MKNSFSGCEKHADASFQHPFLDQSTINLKRYEDVSINQNKG